MLFGFLAGTLCALISLGMPVEKVSAQNLKIKGSAIAGLTESCSKMKKDDEKLSQWGLCESIQEKLKKDLGCSGQMFFAKTNPNVATAKLNEWYVNEERLAACYAKANAALVKVSGDSCKSMQHGDGQPDGPEWEACEKLQTGLVTGFGCSARMFKATGTTAVWTQDQSVIDDCKGKGAEVGRTTIPKPDGSKSSAIATIATEKNFTGAAGEGEAGGASGGGQADCDSTTTSPLSWIICPIIDLGAGFADFVFKDIIRPMLEDVPVSTNEEDGTYQAWKNFRTIGNLVLIGTLLAVVYAQVRGDR